MQSKAATVEEYLAELSDDRREIVQAVRDVILTNLPAGYEEGMRYGMIGYYVPLKVIGEAVKRVPVAKFIKTCEAATAGHRRHGTSAKKANPKK